ncbi:RHS repeat protein [Streptomyces sp. XM4011]|uniref:RHS repeat-associated core domain-containing protein n=1 Tax=Streptomyces sp. XM4011 TaxID=2929780 RepID=UPI001FF861CC|nr:RHS repeat-associated core domain-containing protein [Streptomyces sp. XM4011]MCK1814301.1 RHS repeat protein [Streptomyces sp. XM4011]
MGLATLLFGGMLAGPVAARQTLDLPDAEELEPVPTSPVSGQGLDWPDETETGPEPSWGADRTWSQSEVTELSTPNGTDEAQMQLLSAATAATAGIDGVLIALRRQGNEDQETGPSVVDLELDYGRFAGIYGADWASRLVVREVPECALVTPEADECTARRGLPSHNNVAAGMVSAEIELPEADGETTVGGDLVVPADGETQSATGLVTATGGIRLMALEAAPSGSSGDFTATDLAPTGSWTHGGSAGGFNWSYGLDIPSVPGGLQPGLGLSYSSQSVDGRTAATNNQANWVGDGWSLSPGFIERRYVSCEDDKSGGNNPANKVGDLCWKKENATLALGGSGGELVKDDATGVWRKQDDDGTRVELLTGADNGARNGEHWRVTAPNGTQYYFGLHKLPGWSTGNTVTDSTWTVPVFGNHSAEPCHASSFTDSWCQQAWRWNLDYVVDPLGNAMAYYWAKETNRYARAINSSWKGTPTTYVRGGYLKRVDYGLRSDALHGVDPAGRVTFDVSERCVREGAACDWSKINKDNAKDWPDVPFDQHCASGADCESNYSPSFWTTKRLTSITSYALTGGELKKVDSWKLDHSFPSTGDGSDPALWLKSITRTGHTAESDITLPAVTFRGQQLPNRVEGVLDPIPPLNRYRVYAIDTETGGTIGVTYSQADCNPRNLPSPASNTKRCYPVMWSPPDAPAPDYEPYLDWFHTYVVDQVLESDNTAGAPVVRTDYRYLGGMAWAEPEDEFTKPAHRTYSERKGYGRVQTLTGDPAEGTQTLSETRYFRGINGAQVADTEGNEVADHAAFAGLVRETATYNGDGGTLLSASTHVPWRSAATATHSRDGLPALRAYHVDLKTESARERLADGSWRRTRADRTFDSHGMLSSISDRGDTAVTGDEKCTTISYARNESKNILGLEAETRTVAGTCDQTPSLPDDLLSATRTYYDGSGTLGAAPSRGLATRVDGVDGSGTGYRTVSRVTHDGYGRPLTQTDAAGAESRIAYTPSTGQSPTKTVTTNALGHTTEVHSDARRGVVTATVDANGVRADATYDALGRTTSMWEPGWAKADNPNRPTATFAYSLSRTKPNVVTERRLDYQGDYLTTYTFYDGLLRSRETQGRAVGRPEGKVVSETLYDTAGRVWKSYTPYFADGAASAELVTAADNKVPAGVRNAFDGVGRTTESVGLRYGDEEARTRTVYDGADRTTVIPPEGGTATTTITDALGRKVEQRSYTNAARTAYQATTYGYDQAGNLVTMTDPAGNTWSWEYDKRGNRVRIDDPDTGVTTVSYDVLDRAASATDARGVTMETSFDLLGRKTALEVDGETSAEWTYDTVAKGRPTADISYVDGAAYIFSVDGYNDRYQATSSTLTLPQEEGALAGTYTWSYGYSKRTGVLEWLMQPAMGGLPQERVTTNYTRDGLPFRTTAGQQLLVSNVGHDAFGRPTTTEYGVLGRKVYESRRWDEHTGRLTHQTVAGDIALRIQDTQYTYDDAGNVKRVATVAGQDAASIADTQCFTMDALRRLTEAWTTSTPVDDCSAGASTRTVGGADGYWHQYEYDLAGNRVSETQNAVVSGFGTVTRAYGMTEPGGEGAHALRTLSITGGVDDGRIESFTYDEAGNMTARTGGTRDQEFAWNAEGRLGSVTENGRTTSYVYDASGDRLVARQANGTTTAYLPHGNELTASGDSVTGQRYFEHNGQVVAMRDSTGNSLTFLFSDQQGTALIAVAWGLGQAVQRRKQLPFGGERGSTGSTSWPGDRGFLGGTNDPTGMTHLGAREYDPLLGRFISPDPLMLENDPSQHNGYVYSNNNPLTFADPTGLAYEECFSGQYKCTYGPGRSLDKVEYGKNYEKVTKNLGGTLAPRYVRYRNTMQIACSKDPGCVTWNASHVAPQARAEERLQAERERQAAEERRKNEEKERGFWGNLRDGNFSGAWNVARDNVTSADWWKHFGTDIAITTVAATGTAACIATVVCGGGLFAVGAGAVFLGGVSAHMALATPEEREDGVLGFMERTIKAEVKGIISGALCGRGPVLCMAKGPSNAWHNRWKNKSWAGSPVLLQQHPFNMSSSVRQIVEWGRNAFR